MLPLYRILDCDTPLSTRSQPPLSHFCQTKGHSAEDVENMYQAWFKSITLQVVWCAMPRCIFLIWRYSWNLLVFSSFLTVSIKCCRADDGITLLAALLVLASRLLSIKFHHQRCFPQDASLLSLRLFITDGEQSTAFHRVDASHLGGGDNPQRAL